MQKFKTAVGSLGTKGSGHEQAFTPLVQQLTKYPGLNRAGAMLGIIIVTDAPETELIRYGRRSKILTPLKGSLDNIFVYGIFGPQRPRFSIALETRTSGTIMAASTEKLVTATHGQMFPLCKPFGEAGPQVGISWRHTRIHQRNSIADSGGTDFYRRQISGESSCRRELKAAGGFWDYDAAKTPSLP